jgi:hypothetical protein
MFVENEENGGNIQSSNKNEQGLCLFFTDFSKKPVNQPKKKPKLS